MILNELLEGITERSKSSRPYFQLNESGNLPFCHLVSYGLQIPLHADTTPSHSVQ